MNAGDLRWHEAVLLIKDYRPAGLVTRTEDRGWFYLMRQHFSNTIPKGATFQTLDEAVETAHGVSQVNRITGMILGDPISHVGLAFAQKKKDAWRAVVYDKSGMTPLPGVYKTLDSIVDEIEANEEYSHLFN